MMGRFGDAFHEFLGHYRQMTRSIPFLLRFTPCVTIREKKPDAAH
jgi:hypothetical protein